MFSHLKKNFFYKYLDFNSRYLNKDSNIYLTKLELSNSGDDVYIYEGNTVNHKKHGKGILKNQNGELIYVGNFKDDLFHGRGCLTLNNHDEYEGEFFQQKRSGFGTLISGDKKYRFDGQWENDIKHGKGYEVVTDLYVYDGDFKNGKKEGTGNDLIIIIKIKIKTNLFIFLNHLRYLHFFQWILLRRNF